MKTVRVVIAEDHLMVREGIKFLLQSKYNINVIGESESGEECLKLTKDLLPDVLVMNIKLPDINGIYVLEKLKKYNFNVKVIILTGQEDLKFLSAAVDLGVDGYLLKKSDISELADAIETVVSGEKYLQADLVKKVNLKQKSKVKNDLKKIDDLTKREIEVLKLLSVGMYNKEVAETLSISERTVKNHVSNIFKKIEVTDRTQAAVFAIKNDLVKI